MKRIDESGPTALVQMPEPVNNFPDFVRHIVQRLKTLCPSLGTVEIAQMLGLARGVTAGRESGGERDRGPTTEDRRPKTEDRRPKQKALPPSVLGRRFSVLGLLRPCLGLRPRLPPFPPYYVVARGKRDEERLPNRERKG